MCVKPVPGGLPVACLRIFVGLPLPAHQATVPTICHIDTSPPVSCILDPCACFSQGISVREWFDLHWLYKDTSNKTASTNVRTSDCTCGVVHFTLHACVLTVDILRAKETPSLPRYNSSPYNQFS